VKNYLDFSTQSHSSLLITRLKSHRLQDSIRLLDFQLTLLRRRQLKLLKTEVSKIQLQVKLYKRSMIQKQDVLLIQPQTSQSVQALTSLLEGLTTSKQENCSQSTNQFLVIV
jgi:hypothetical protein